MKISYSNAPLPGKGTIIFTVLEGAKLSPCAAQINDSSKGKIKKAIKSSAFTGKLGEKLALIAPHGTLLDKIVLIGLGKASDIDTKTFKELGGQTFHLLAKECDQASIVLEAFGGIKLKVESMAADFGFGARLRSYSFTKYRTTLKKEEKNKLKLITVYCKEANKARSAYAARDKVVDGVFYTRDLVSEPANILYPAEFARRAKKDLSKLGVKVSVFGEKEIKKLGMGALLGVAQGSVRAPRLVMMEWNGLGAKSKNSAKPLAFIGKGVCFDTGGISIKPSGGMEDMKWDMGGAGVVTGLMKALAGRKSKSHVIGAIGLVENMPDGNAQRPGDIVKSMSGQTIEVLNTDAEGRLVLCDVLHYVNKIYKPQFMVDLATLTGAIIIALGDQHAGLFSNNDKLAHNLKQSGDAVDELLWRLPLSKKYNKLLDCEVADMKNISGGRGAGSITAAQFLERFVGKTPWAHLDIAGVTWSKSASSTTPKGGTAFGVQLLDHLVSRYYE